MYERGLVSKGIYKRKLFNRVFFQSIIDILPPCLDFSDEDNSMYLQIL